MWKWILRQYRESSPQIKFPEKERKTSEEDIESEKVLDLIRKIRNDIKRTNKELLWIHLNELSCIFRIWTEETLEKHNRRITKLLESLQSNDEEGHWENPLQERDYWKNTEGVAIDTKDKPKLILPNIQLIMDKSFSHGEIQITPYLKKWSENEREALLLRIYGIELWKIPRILSGTLR